MKTTILVFFCVLAFVYLIGCFIQLSFNINFWSISGRALASIFGTLIGIIISGFYYANKY